MKHQYSRFPTLAIQFLEISKCSISRPGQNADPDIPLLRAAGVENAAWNKQVGQSLVLIPRVVVIRREVGARSESGQAGKP